ncbi:conserved hypothetical protein [Gammaproteobacteria bacterium]
MKYYKFLTREHTGGYSSFDWTPYLPTADGPGEWTPEIEGELVDCENGYHLCDETQILGSYIQDEMYEAEVEDCRPCGENDKHVARRVMLVRRVDGWNDKTLRLFAVWCGREAMKLIPDPDPRSIAACDVAERYANGDATSEDLDAAWGAAWGAASAAAWAAAWGAAWGAASAAARDAQLSKLREMVGL